MIRLAEASGMPVAVMPNAKGFFPENHPNYIGMFGAERERACVECKGWGGVGGDWGSVHLRVL